MTDPRIARYQEAGARGARFTLGFQQPDGGYLWEGYPPDAFHKQSYSWAIAGEIEGAQRLLSWVKAQRLLPDGQLRDYHGDIYKHALLFQGAHRLGRFDLTYPMARFLLSCQAPCGGFPHLAGEPYCRALAGCQAGIGLLYIGSSTRRRGPASGPSASWSSPTPGASTTG